MRILAIGFAASLIIVGIFTGMIAFEPTRHRPRSRPSARSYRNVDFSDLPKD